MTDWLSNEQHCSWECNSWPANEESSCLLWNLKCPCYAHSMPLVPILSQKITPFPSLQLCFAKIHFNIILILHQSLLRGLLLSCFPMKLCLLSFTHMIHSSPIKFFLKWLSYNVHWRVQIMNLSTHSQLPNCFVIFCILPSWPCC